MSHLKKAHFTKIKFETTESLTLYRTMQLYINGGCNKETKAHQNNTADGLFCCAVSIWTI